jgi:hypothetical protein
MSESSGENTGKELAESLVEYTNQQGGGETGAITATEQLRSLLREAGMLVERSKLEDIRPPISAERREELARRFSVGKPLSQIIIEDRVR